MPDGFTIEHLEQRRPAFIFALMTAADSVMDVLFKARAAELLLTARQLREAGANREAVVLLVEGEAGLRPRSRIWDLIQSMPLLEEVDGLYRIRERIFLSDFHHGERPLPRALLPVSWSIDEVIAAFFPADIAAWTVRNVQDAIGKGYRWFLWTLAEGFQPEHPFEVLPAFWECGQAGDMPVGELRAVTSIADTLGALAETRVSLSSIANPTRNYNAAFSYGLKQLLRYGAESDPPLGWDQATRHWVRGGFFPYDDQPESAYPTVDATWSAVLALCSLYGHYDGIVEAYGQVETPKEVLGAALVGGALFLARMQLPSGGWGIYRYPGGFPDVAPHEFTTGQAILALCRVLDTNVLEEYGQASMRGAIEASLRRSWAFLKGRVLSFGGLAVWAPFFGSNLSVYSTADTLCATIWTATGLLALYQAFHDLRSGIAPLLKDILVVADRNWALDYSRAADVQFRVPLKDRLNDVFGKWSNRYDVTVALLLLDLSNEASADETLQLTFTSELWDRLERTLGLILSEQHSDHGHWHEPIDGLPLAAATAMAMQALRSYLFALGQLARQDVSTAKI